MTNVLRGDSEDMAQPTQLPEALVALLKDLNIFDPAAAVGKTGNEAESYAVNPYQVAKTIIDTVTTSSRILSNYQYRVLNRILGLEHLEVRRNLESEASDVLKRRYERQRALIVDALVALNRPLVGQIVKQWEPHNPRMTWGEDYLQAGMLGLVEAIISWDPDMSPLDSWAKNKIRHRVQVAVQQNEFQNLRPSEFALRGRMMKAMKELRAAQDPAEEEPSLEALAAHMGEDLEKLEAVMSRARPAPSLQDRVSDAEDSDELIDLLTDVTSFEDDLVEEITNREHLARIFALVPQVLTEEERYALWRRVGFEMDGIEETEKEVPFAVIADEIGFSREGARLKVKTAISKLNHPNFLSNVDLKKWQEAQAA